MKRILQPGTERRGFRAARITAAAFAFAFGAAVSAANAGTSDTFKSGTSLLSASNYGSGNLPGNTTDVTLTLTTATAGLTIGSGATAGAVTMESLTDASTTTTYTVTNATTGSTNSTLTLGSGGTFTNANDSVANDLIAVTGSKTLTITGANSGGGSGTLGLVLASSGNFDVSGTGTLAISANISQASGTTATLTIDGNSNKTNTLTGTNTFSGGLVINSTAAGETDVSADANLGAAGGSVTILNGRLGINGGATVGASLVIDPTRSFFLGSNSTGSNSGANLAIKGTSFVTYNGSLQDATGVTGDLVRQAGGTLILGGQSTYSGSTFLNNGITQLTVGNNRLPTGTTVYLGQLAGASSANSGTLNLNGFNQQVAGLNSTSSGSSTIVPATKNTVTSATGSTLTLGGSGTYAYGDGTAMNSGVLTGALSVVKSGTGTQTFGDNNTFTGTTTVSAGTLITGTATSGSSVQALSGTSGVFVNNGGTLQMGAANQFNATTPAPVTLAGATGAAATFSVNGNNQGSKTANGVGALTLALNSANNVIDFNSKNGVVTFASFTPNGATLTVNNYLNNNGASGGPDELIFNQDQGPNGQNDLGSFVFTNYGAATEAALGNGFYEVFPTAVPEPATVFGGCLMVGLLGWNQRRQLRGLAGSIRKTLVA